MGLCCTLLLWTSWLVFGPVASIKLRSNGCNISCNIVQYCWVGLAKRTQHVATCWINLHGLLIRGLCHISRFSSSRSSFSSCWWTWWLCYCTLQKFHLIHPLLSRLSPSWGESKTYPSCQWCFKLNWCACSDATMFARRWSNDCRNTKQQPRQQNKSCMLLHESLAKIKLYPTSCNIVQHCATGWSNGCNMLRVTMLHDVAWNVASVWPGLKTNVALSVLMGSADEYSRCGRTMVGRTASLVSSLQNWPIAFNKPDQLFNLP